MKKHVLYIALSLLAVISCEQLPEDVMIHGIGCKEKEVALEANAGEFELTVYADGEFTAILDEEDSWLRFKGMGDSRTLTSQTAEGGKVVVAFSYELNKGVPRTAVLSLVRGTNKYELSFVQAGVLSGGIEVEQKNISAEAQGGQYAVKVITKIKSEDLKFDVEYTDDQIDWISNFSLKNNFICFAVQPNLSSSIRSAVISVKTSEGLGYMKVVQVYGGYTETRVTVEGLKQLSEGASEYSIEEHLVLTGVVINDNSDKNGAENRMVSHDVQDLAYAERILYVQNEEGTSGIKLIFDKSCSQFVSRYDRISVDLKGLTLKREGEDTPDSKFGPIRYSVSGIPTAALMDSAPGDAPQPKGRLLEEIVDDDLYTLVNVGQLEIPVRKGSYAPINTKFVGIMTAYPMVIRSKGGATGHMMVNVDCSWSRNGDMLPRGSGSVTGVVVYETCDNFEWDSEIEKNHIAEGTDANSITGLGHIGRYQLRPMFEEDVDLKGPAFSKLMYEWAYIDTLGVNLVKTYENKRLYPSYSEVEEGQNPLEFKASFYCADTLILHKASLAHSNDYTILGPYTFGKKMPSRTQGNGIKDYNGREIHWNNEQGGETIGVVYSANGIMRWGADKGEKGDNGGAWCMTGWTNTDQCWCVEFSTAGLSEANSPLNLTFGTYNDVSGAGAPRNWVVEWSRDRNEWDKVQEYTVPDFAISGVNRTYHLPGIKYITVNLPYETLQSNGDSEEDMVYVRMRPRDTKAGTTSSYDGGKIGSKFNAINYIAIRYNK